MRPHYQPVRYAILVVAARNQPIKTSPPLDDLTKLVNPYNRGDPTSPLRWVAKNNRILATALQDQGHQVSRTTVRKLLKSLGYTLQSNVKSKEPMTFKDRDQQFETINDTAKDFLASGDQVIAVDTKKKELIGKYKMPGKEQLPMGKPRRVNSHDFGDKDEHMCAMKVSIVKQDCACSEGLFTVGFTVAFAEFDE